MASTRAREKFAKGNRQAQRRAVIYAICGALIVLCIVIIGIDNLTNGAISAFIPRLVFYGERIGLISFGISWLTASRVLPGLTQKEERFSPLADEVPAIA